MNAVALVERRGVRTSFVWGFAEATLFFVLPDVAVGAVALFGLRRGLKAAGAAILGAVLGGAVLYLCTRGFDSGVRDLLDALPAIPDRFFDQAASGIADEGGRAVVRGPSLGIPYKVYVAEWALTGRNLLALLLWTVPARAARIVPMALVSWLAGRVWRRLFGPDRTGLLLLAYGLVWVTIYVVYFSKVGLY